MSDPTDTRVLRVVGGGEPTAEELAALVAALTSRSQAAQVSAARSRWAHRSGAMRAPLPHGPGAWRASARSVGVYSA